MSRRQDPVSCALCRRKKLRCSRQQPCSNCVARGVPCEREAGLPSPDAARTVAGSSSDLVNRLQRLEDLLLRVDAKVTAPINSHTPDSTSYSSAQHQTPTTLQYAIASKSATEVAHQADTRILEDVSTKDNRLLVSLANELSYEIKDIDDIAAQAASRQASGVVVLPLKAQAIDLLNVYHQHIEYLHHITYRPHVRRALDQVYSAIEQDTKPSHDSAALVLSILASSAALQFALADENILGISPDNAYVVCRVWAKGAFDCLDHSRRLGQSSLEGLQAAITVFFLMYNLEGFSSRSRVGVAIGLGQAKDLGLHRVDHPSSASDGLGKVDREIRRRIWWHSVATDWQLSVSGGPQEGSYHINPRHVATRLPRHIEEEDLELEDEDFERPLSVPTASSYLVQRIKLAEVCRHISDTMPFGSSGADSVNYGEILALDAEFEHFLNNLPPFFHNTAEAREQYRQLYEDRPSILVQKYTVNMICQTRRCRLHQPYLVRGFTDASYAQSRDVCLKSARVVIGIKHELDRSRATAASLLALSGIHHHMFFAVVALVMDICFNKTEGDEQVEATRQAEVRDALRILEQAKDRSPVAKRFLDSLMDVMRKHKIKLIDTATTSGAPQASMSARAVAHSATTTNQSRVIPTLVDSSQRVPAAPLGAITLTDDFDISCMDHYNSESSDFDEIWQSYIEHGPNFDIPDWDDLYSDLQMQSKSGG